MPCAGRLLCRPASTTSVRRRARPSTSAALSPAAPPPTTMQSQVFDTRSSCACGQELSNLFADMANEGPEAVEARVRRRLRELRAERGLTLQQVATRASLDVSTLSRLETGKRRLALDHVPALAAALGVTSDDLLGSGPPHRPARPQRADPPQQPDDVAADARASSSGLRAYRVEIDAERNAPPDPLPVHEGYDWMYVLEGRLRLILDDHEHVIEPGEAAEFSTWTPHWFGALDGPVQMVLIVGPHGERIHLHA